MQNTPSCINRDLSLKAELAFFFLPRLFNKTKAPIMDKVHGNINGFSLATSPRPCRL